jgi:hypothetical protein
MKPPATGMRQSVQVERRCEAMYGGAIHHLRVDAVQRHRVGPAPLNLQFFGAVREFQHPALAQHDIEVEVRGQRLVQAQRMLVKSRAFGVEIIGSADLGIAAGVAAAEPAFFKHGDVADSVLAGQIAGRRQTVATGADDNNRVMVFRFGAAPGRPPGTVPGEAVAQQAGGRVRVHRRRIAQAGGKTNCRSPARPSSPVQK